MARLHPHLQHFIRSIVLTEMGEKIGMSKAYEWKEGVMTKVQELVMKSIDQAQTQQDLGVLVDHAVDEFVSTQLPPVLDAIKKALKSIPLDVIRQVTKKKA